MKPDAGTTITYFKCHASQQTMTARFTRWKTTVKASSNLNSHSKRLNPALSTARRGGTTLTTRIMTGDCKPRSHPHEIPFTNVVNLQSSCGYFPLTLRHWVLYCHDYDLATLRGPMRKIIAPIPVMWRTAVHITSGLTATAEPLLVTSEIESME